MSLEPIVQTRLNKAELAVTGGFQEPRLEVSPRALFPVAKN